MALPDKIRERLSLPAVVAPMFLVSGPALAAEACKAGLIGSLTGNNCRTVEELEAQLGEVNERLARFRDVQPGRVNGPLALNIAANLDANGMRRHMALCRRYGVSIVITAVGNPAAQAPWIRDAALLHFHDATSVRFAEKAIAAGVDGIIAIGAGGGGHSGSISHLSLIPHIRSMFDGIIVMAGAVTTGANIRAAEILGADLAYLGTRFIATRESLAPDEYKAMLVDGTAADVVFTGGINGVPANWLKASLRASGLDPDNLPVPEKRGYDHLPPGVLPWKNLWSGSQGISLINDIPSVAELVHRLQQEYVEACQVADMANAARAALQRKASVA